MKETPQSGFAGQRRLAVPEQLFGLTLFLRFFDRCGSASIALSAAGSALLSDPNEFRSPASYPGEQRTTSSSITAKNTAHRMVDCAFSGCGGRIRI